MRNKAIDLDAAKKRKIIVSGTDFNTNPTDFGRTVINLLERDYGVASLNEALTVEAKNRPVLAKSLR